MVQVRVPISTCWGSYLVREFAKNLQNAITFAPIKDVSTFVRRYILEEKPIRVKELQESLKRYRDIEKKTREVKDRIDALKVIRQFYEESGRKLTRSQQYDWIEMEAKVARLDMEANRLEAQSAEQQNADKKLKDAHEEQQKKIEID